MAGVSSTVDSGSQLHSCFLETDVVYRRLQDHRMAFTLIELLVVIAIIGILIGLLLPAVNSARDAGRRMQCQNNVKQLVLGCHIFEDATGALPLLYSSSNQLGWITQILPYLELQSLSKQYNFGQPWFDASNAAAVRQRVSTLECPSSPVPHVYTATDPAFAGQGAKPLTTFTVASTDYFAICGASSTTTLKAQARLRPGIFAFTPTPLRARIFPGHSDRRVRHPVRTNSHRSATD